MSDNQSVLRLGSLDGEGLSIEIKGPSKQFGGLDLKVLAIKSLIETLDFKFQEEEDYDISQKTYLTLLDTIGSMIRVDSPAYEYIDRNIGVVQEFLRFAMEEKLYNMPGYKELVDQKDPEDDI